MAGYNRPQKTLHKEFLYLNHTSVLNSLSAFEAGQVDEIIERTTNAKAGGIEASVGAGPARAGGSRKKQNEVQEELIRTRTWFSAFDAWHRHLSREEAIGTFDDWSLDVREELQVGDTIEFSADVSMMPLHKVLTTFIAFVEGLGPQSIFSIDQRQANEFKKIAKQTEAWISSGPGKRSFLVQMRPISREPRIMARLSEEYIVANPDTLEGRFTVIGQVDRLLGEGEEESVLRIIRDVPATPIEVETISQALSHFVEPAKALGIDIKENDLQIRHPSVLLQPIAVFR